MPQPPHTKPALRDTLRRRRQALDAAQQADAAEALCDSVLALPGWAGIRRIAVYLPADGEIGTGPLATRARQGGKTLYLPVIAADNHLDFALWEAGLALAPNRYGICEPPRGSAICPPAELDLICLPLVGWDRRGARLGMGGGFYDRSLAGVRGPILMGLAHAHQEVEAIPLEDWDVQLDYVATECALVRCHRNGVS